MGFIYIINGPLNIIEENKSYIGYTTNTLSRRWSKWKIHFKYYMEGKKISYSRYMCEAVAKYGINNFEMQCVEECKNNILEEKEIHWIKEKNTMVPHGYNIQSGGNHAPPSIETRKIISQKSKKDVSKELPMYINYFERTREGITRHGYKITYPPAKKEKYVTVRKNKPITREMLEKAKYLLNELKELHNNPLQNIEILPKNIFNYKRKNRHGYRVAHKPSGCNRYITTSIEDPISNDMLEEALNALKKLEISYTKQQL